MGKAADQPQDDPKPEPEKTGLGGPFGPHSGDLTDAYGRFVRHLNERDSVDCTTVFKTKKEAEKLTALEFESCYYGARNKQGRSLELSVRVMKPGADGIPRPEAEKITTLGRTMDSRRLDVYMHALPAVRPVSFENNGKTSAGSAAMISKDGLMVTNHHVVEGSNGTVQVKMLRPDGSEEIRNARVVKLNPKQDLALLQLDTRPGESFAALPISQKPEGHWLQNEPLVQMGNANGEGRISLAKARYHKMINQRNIPFSQQPADVLQGRTLFELESTAPQGYSGGVVLSVPGSEQNADGAVSRTGTSAIRGITTYSDLTRKTYIVPAARVQFMLDEYLKEKNQKK